MDTDLARHVIRTAFQSARELESLLAPVKAHCSAEEYAKYSKAIATAIASIHLEIVNRVTSDQPGLEGEIEAKIAKYGRYV
jgi:hypothetical protein